jgi:tetratricopeptide (TPR) repeat protein
MDAMGKKRSFLGERDGFLTLYYEGGTDGLFDPIPTGWPEDEGSRDEAAAAAEFAVAFCERVLAADPDYVEALSFLGNTYTQRGEHERGADLDRRLVRLRPFSARAHYNLACSYALLGRAEDAFAALDRAVECGFDDPEHFTKDPDLSSLHDDPRFKALHGRVREAARPEKGAPEKA